MIHLYADCTTTLPNILYKTLIRSRLQHSTTVGMGFIPVLPTADKIQSKYPAAARAGINPAPTEDRCNTLVINAFLYEEGLPTADKIQSKCPPAARAGINPAPTEDRCSTFVIKAFLYAEG